jgi:hypothetical protein
MKTKLIPSGGLFAAVFVLAATAAWMLHADKNCEHRIAFTHNRFISCVPNCTHPAPGGAHCTFVQNDDHRMTCECGVNANCVVDEPPVIIQNLRVMVCDGECGWGDVAYSYNVGDPNEDCVFVFWDIAVTRSEICELES